jgi:hypothetical protein
MISIVNTECHVPKTFSDLAKIAAWGRLGHMQGSMLSVQDLREDRSATASQILPHEADAAWCAAPCAIRVTSTMSFRKPIAVFPNCPIIAISAAGGLSVRDSPFDRDPQRPRQRSGAGEAVETAQIVETPWPCPMTRLRPSRSGARLHCAGCST